MKVLLGFALLLAATVVKCQEETDSYIVLLKEGATDEHLEAVIQQMEKYSSQSRDEMSIESENSVLPVLFGEFNEEVAEFLSSLDNVDIVEKDQIVSDESNIHSDDMSADDLEASEDLIDTDRYNLDIVDDVTCADGTYEPFNYGAGADIYVLSTGINYDHVEFGYRNGETGSRAKFSNYDIVDRLTKSKQRGRDCRGPGTHYAGVAAGLYSGIAKDANVYSVRVVDCNGKALVGFLLRGLSGVKYSHAVNSRKAGFVGTIASITTSFPSSHSYVLDRFITACVVKGIVVVSPAGDNRMNSCYRYPGKSRFSINVGNHGYLKSTCVKPMAQLSNYGKCNAIIAPGVRVRSASNNSDTELTVLSGTAVSSSHVAGTAALMKSGNNSLYAYSYKEQNNG